MLSKVPPPVKTATRNFDYVLHILHFRATRFLVNFFWRSSTLTVCYGGKL